MIVKLMVERMLVMGRAVVNGKRDPTCVWEGGGHTCGVEQGGGVVGRVMVVGRLTHRVGVRVIMIRRLMEKVVVRFVCWLVGWLLNVPATCECISGTDLLRQLYVLSH